MNIYHMSSCWTCIKGVTRWLVWTTDSMEMVEDLKIDLLVHITLLLEEYRMLYALQI